jgi:flavin-dependent dehydrogenase
MSSVRLEDHSRVAVIGGGPAGSFFSYFLLDMAQRVGKQVTVDVYEARDFDRVGPAGCNNCGGIISEWLVQALAADGINLPTDVVERGIDSYVLHTDLGDVRIAAPLQEKRIGAVQGRAASRTSAFAASTASCSSRHVPTGLTSSTAEWTALKCATGDRT